jgi:sporulation integral membrane protein YtvI
MNNDKIKQILNVSLLLLSVGILGLVFLDYILPVLLPFIISYTTAYLSNRPAVFLERRLKIPRKRLRPIIAIASLALVFFLLFLLVKQTGIALWELASGLLEGDNIRNLIEQVIVPIEATFGSIIPTELTEGVVDSLKSLFSTVVSSIGSFVAGIATILPKVFLFLVITVISLVYFSLDLEGINQKIGNYLPPKARKSLSDIRGKFLDVGIKYVYSYLTIMGITFAVVLSGFLLLSVKRSVLLAILIASLDLLPVIGVGTVLIPWGVIELILGNTGRGIGFIVLFAVNEIIRQYAEPKIVGKNLNMHPVVTLILIYASFSLFGFKGILLIPILTVIANALFEGGKT